MSAVTAVIPVRYAAQRLPGKPLIPLLGKPMVCWVVEAAQRAQKIDRLIVATDDKRIAEAVAHLKVEVVMTSSELPSGTDRVHAASLTDSNPYVINIQGDEPLMDPEMIDLLAEQMRVQQNWEIMTLARPMDEESLSSINAVKVILDKNDNAIYFSRHPIPYSRIKSDGKPEACLKHLGIYGYKKEFLGEFCQTPAQNLERLEGLEQLRALYLGGRIRVLQVPHESIGVDTPDDVNVVEELLRKKYGQS